MTAIRARLTWSLTAIAVVAVLGAAPAPASAALLKTVTAGSFTFTTGIATTNVALPAGTSLTNSFVVCGHRTSNTQSITALVSCQLNNGGAGGATQLTLTAGGSPGNNAMVDSHQRFVTAFVAAGRTTSVETIVPVAGTSITSGGLYGGWCVEVFLDADDTPVVARPFELAEPR